jgi:hypothetical protein
VTDPLYFSQGIILPYNFIKDIEVITGGYEAQYRSSLGGIVNVVTQSGGDKFSGQVFGFYTGKRFTADTRLVPGEEPDEGDYSLYDLGLSIGGPLIKEKLWLNAAYNPNFQNEEVLIPGIGNETDKLLWNQVAGKLSWSISESAQLILNYTGEFYNADRVAVWVPSGLESYLNPDPALTKVSWENYSPSIRGFYFFSNKFFIEGAFSRFQLNVSVQPRTETGNEPAFFNYENSTISGGVIETHNELAVRYNYSLKSTLSLNDHIVKAGIEYLDNSFNRNQDVYEVFKYSDSLYYSYVLDQHGAVGNRIPAAYLQDEWRLNKNWQFNAGVRWEGQFIIGSDGKVAQKILDQFQPRIGLIFSPAEDGNQKLFLSYGRFYQELADAAISYYYLKDIVAVYREYDHDPRENPNGGDTLYYATGQIQEEISGFKAQYSDEFSLGYERRFWDSYKFSVRGIYRWLGEGIEDAYSEDWQKFVIGNPGRNPLSEYPNPNREYMALEFVIERVSSDPLNFSLAYVLSRNYGNYQGLFEGSFAGNATIAFDYPEMLENGTGLLPYDRTHALKFSGSYRFRFGLNLGVICSWMSGTPLNEFGIGSDNFGRIFLQPRGTAGRTPDIWDINLRVAYVLPTLTSLDYQARLILDVFHIASTQVAVNYDQLHYLGVDENGNQTYPNPTYGEPTSFQPPMSLRFGIEINF